MKTVIIQIGNSDDKLTQQRWAAFHKEINGLTADFSKEMHFAGASEGTEPWQNACWIFQPLEQEGWKGYLRSRLEEIRKRYGQDSVALTFGESELV